MTRARRARIAKRNIWIKIVGCGIDNIVLLPPDLDLIIVGQGAKRGWSELL